jgi:hypothetical protein
MLYKGRFKTEDQYLERREDMENEKQFAPPVLTEYGRLSELTMNHDPNTGQNPCSASPSGSPPENAKQGPSYDCMTIGSES